MTAQSISCFSVLFATMLSVVSSVRSATVSAVAVDSSALGCFRSTIRIPASAQAAPFGRLMSLSSVVSSLN
uniref:Putative secreted peptide n=1 Tax=Anopheles braziliensis TaxID=58242 RepID=A0A2M3ZTI8_9DIPT